MEVNESRLCPIFILFTAQKRESGWLQTGNLVHSTRAIVRRMKCAREMAATDDGKGKRTEIERTKVDHHMRIQIGRSLRDSK